MGSLKKIYGEFGLNEKIILAFFTVIAIYSFSLRLGRIYADFPRGYQWQDLFISWSGGLVRRGLIGEIFSFIASSPHLALYVIIIFVCIYLCWYAFLVRTLYRSFNHFWFIILLGSPSIGAFIFQAQQEILRKDIFIYIFIASTFWIIGKLDTHKKYVLTLIMFSFLYIPFFLIHELTLLYSGFCFILMWNLYATGDRRKITAIYFFLLCACSLAFLYYFTGTPEIREAIYKFWESRIPDFRPHYAWGAIDYIGVSPLDRPAFSTSYAYFGIYGFRIALAKAFLLTYLPVGCVYYAYNFHYIHNRLFGAWSTWLFYGIAISSLIAIVSVMNDFGRIFSDYAIYLILYLAGLIKLAKYYNIERAPRLQWSLSNPCLFLLAFCYLFLWKIEHWMPLEAENILSIQAWQANLLGFK